MNWYFITICILYALSLGVTLAQHGKPKEGKQNFWLSLFTIILQLFLIINAIKVGF